MNAILKRYGCPRAPRRERAAAIRYEWRCPGDLLHMDVRCYPRFAGRGTRSPAMGRARRSSGRHPLGHDYFHAIVDDHSRLAYGELLGDERAATVTAFVERALAWLTEHGTPLAGR